MADLIPDIVWHREPQPTPRQLRAEAEQWWQNLITAYHQLEEIAATGPDDMCVDAARQLLGDVARQYIRSWLAAVEGSGIL